MGSSRASDRRDGAPGQPRKCWTSSATTSPTCQIRSASSRRSINFSDLHPIRRLCRRPAARTRPRPSRTDPVQIGLGVGTASHQHHHLDAGRPADLTGPRSRRGDPGEACYFVLKGPNDARRLLRGPAPSASTRRAFSSTPRPALRVQRHRHLGDPSPTATGFQVAWATTTSTDPARHHGPRRPAPPPLGHDSGKPRLPDHGGRSPPRSSRRPRRSPPAASRRTPPRRSTALDNNPDGLRPRRQPGRLLPRGPIPTGVAVNLHGPRRRGTTTVGDPSPIRSTSNFPGSDRDDRYPSGNIVVTNNATGESRTSTS